MADVRNYNQDIAEYVLTTAPPGSNAKALVARLILATKPNSGPAAGATAPITHATAGRSPQPRIADESTHRPSSSRRKPSSRPDAVGPAADQARAESQDRLEPSARSDEHGGTCRRWGHCSTWPIARSACRSWPTCCTGTATCRPNVRRRSRWPIACAAPVPQHAAGRVGRLLAGPRAGGPLSGAQRTGGAVESAAGHRRQRCATSRAWPTPDVRVQAARRAAKAAVLDAHVALLDAEFDLTHGGRPHGSTSLGCCRPRAPQSGRYRLAEAPAARRPQPALGRGDSPGVTTKLEERADAVLASRRRPGRAGQRSAQARRPATGGG